MFQSDKKERNTTKGALPDAESLPAWHTLESEKVFSHLDTNSEGLTSDDVQQRLDRYGYNRLPEIKPPSALMRLLLQFNNLLIYVLIGAGIVTVMLGHIVDAGVIFGVVVINAVIGFIQEGKAENALRAIKQMLSLQAMVIRNGHRITIPADQLVPGDIVALQSGDKVPADLRLFQLKNLQIQEAILTGESVAVEKSTLPVANDAVLGDRICMAYSGTLVTYGQGTGVVVATGGLTEIGCISTLVAHVEKITTPMLRQMDQFSRLLTIAILFLAGLTFLFGIAIRDYAASEMFIAAVGLAVAAIPEGLPAIMTITLAIGVQRMAKRNAIIRRLPAVETLGAVEIICSDKTGTLTCNEMTVRTIITPNHRFLVGGAGYDLHGNFSLDDADISPDDHPQLLNLLQAATLCNDASLEVNEDSLTLHGSPMEGALLVAGYKAGLQHEEELKLCPRTDLIPFESQHRFMATLHHGHTGAAWIFLKGAPERVIEMCGRQINGESYEAIDAGYWENEIERMAAEGQRVLAVAVKPAKTRQSELDFSDIDDELALLGLFGLIDPPRQEAISAVSRCQAAGIRVKMITGDHAATAMAIARQLNLLNSSHALTGREIESESDDELRQQVREVDVYARVSPEHKLRLVELLQSEGAIVAMTGDGVNDAPALKRADVGTAMGQMGTEAAKEASEMVLADDNFASISYAVEEGRTVYDNLRKSILFILPTNGGEALIIIAAIALGFHELPLTPAQILWVNMITAVTLALALAFEPAESNVMQRPPRNPTESILSMLLIWRIGFVSVILMIGTFGLYLWDTGQGGSIEHARTIAVNTLVMFEIFYLFNSRSITAPVLNRTGLFGNRYALIAIGLLILFQLGFTYLPPFQKLFGTAAITFSTWLVIIATASSVLFLVEAEKWVFRTRSENRKR
ncbi:MAG: cation-transporting P-type ATPase [Candidatus Sedimenticola sp. (ex Thyasira tokunagai)]